MKSEACKYLLPDGNEVIPLVRQGITQRGIAEGLDRRGNPLCLCGTLQRIYNEFKFLLMTRDMWRDLFSDKTGALPLPTKTRKSVLPLGADSAPQFCLIARVSHNDPSFHSDRLLAIYPSSCYCLRSRISMDIVCQG